MERCDNDMPFLLKYENVAWYENGKVRILDRRVYPTEVKFVECTDYKEVVKCIQDMVTQSTGPYTAVGMGMALAAYECKDKPEKEQEEFLKKASEELANSRPTAAHRYGKVTGHCLDSALKALKEGKDTVQACVDRTIESLNRRYSTMQIVGDYLCDIIPDNGTILTQCYGETIIATVIRAAHRKNKIFKAFCAETRPFFQGARLTASCFAEMGIDTTVVSDNMIAWALQTQGIDLFTSACDAMALDGYIANKVGSFQIAILSKYFGIPYYVTGLPDLGKKTKDDITIEMRDPEQVLSARGIRNCRPEVHGLYPAFDIVPPHLITGLVTDKGVYVPELLRHYFDTPVQEYY
ncbi:MAG: S-methyl-5-thioribose-1-phosphate isomerase [Lachnospiraceae bacterium]|nr:S-methyl-5-thioribose-1-phosphate isomerase [Lachnospiraceae bacterium]